MEPNEAIVPAHGSAADVAARLALWGRRAPKGLARVEFDSDFSRQDTVVDLRRRLEAAGVPFHEIELPKFEPAERIVQFLTDSLAQLGDGVVSITGWATAFPTDVPLLDSLRVLNYNRENLAQFPLCQVWWLPRSFTDTFIQTIPDLNSWFIVSLSLSESRTCSVETERPTGSFRGDAVNLDFVRQTSAELVSRFHQAVRSKTAPSALLGLARVAVVALHNAGLRQEAQRLAATLLDEIINAAVSLGLLDSPAQIEENTDSAWGTMFRSTFLAGSHVVDAALLYDMQGKGAEAEALYKKAIALATEAAGRDQSLTDFARESLASLYRGQGRYEEAVAVYKRIIEELTKGLKDKDEDLKRVPRIVIADRYYDLADTYVEQGNFADAEKLYRRVLVIQKQHLGPYAGQLIWVLRDLSALYKMLGRFDEASLYQRQRDAIKAAHQDALFLNGLTP